MKLGMHCLGAVAGGQVSPSGNNSSSSNDSSNNCSSNNVLSIIRALGVLVCEGRIQGPPRGYREGPHCVQALQSQPNSDHACEKDNYLCDRYLVLVREITDHVSVGAYLCVEVVLCSDCPCGSIKSKSKHRVLSVPPPLTSWQHSSEMLLEYWRIGVVPSKSPETMNCHGLYQAVRSRLHFSQVAAWWSRTNGSRPSYVATRIVPNTSQSLDDHLKRFRDAPAEHTFPLAGLGDGNSIEVSVWALPRMEEIPQLQCAMHPPDELEPQLVRPTTPVKRLISTSPVIPTSPPANQTTTTTTNNNQQQQQSHTTSLESNTQTQQQPNFVYYMSSFRSAGQPQQQQQQQQQQAQPVLLDDRLLIPCDKPGKHHCRCADEEDEELDGTVPTPVSVVSSIARPNGERKRRRSLPCRPPEPDPPEPQHHVAAPPSSLPALQEITLAPPAAESTHATTTTTTGSLEGLERSFRTQLSIDEQQEHLEKRYKRSESVEDESTETENTNGDGDPSPRNRVARVNLVVNPLCSDEVQPPETPKKEKEGEQQGVGILDWISRVPYRVLGAEQQEPVANKCEVRMHNSCNLELSPREFDEVLAVLRARTPLCRKRSAVRTAKRREANKQQEHQTTDGSASRSKAADALLGAILRSSSRDNDSRDEVITEVTRDWTTPRKDDDDDDEPATPSNSVEARDSSNNDAESSLPSALNKRFSRLKQLFKRSEHEQRLTTPEDGGRGTRPNGIPAESRVKRKIDFSTDFEDSPGDDELEDEEEDEPRGEESADRTAHCDHPVGTSTNGAHPTSLHSTNGDKRTGCAAPVDGKSTLSRKSHGKRDLFLARFKHNKQNNKNETVAECEGLVKVEASAEESESGTEVEQAGVEANDKTTVPSAKDQARFRRSLENAASMVFHSRTGLPLTSSPAPLRRGSCCFDFDSSLNSVSSKRSALFELNTPPSPGAVSLEEGDREAESTGDTEEVTKRRSASRHRPQSHALLGSFEESALNGRLEPVSTVHGFAAEIGASGSFCPKHRKLPVTVFFYTLGDNDKVSSPYLAHINLGKKPYQVPRMGTIQVTLLNPLGTVVKMFVVLYDLTDMPPRSHTFLRQRTLRDKTLRYLIHLRFMSGKTGRIYLHTDVRIIICRKADVDTASDFGSEPPKELRSYTHGPTNPKFSPRC
ncbi:protein FAM214A isoform X2 [Copidosoma floridanum]|uniref:protein FAM214A isoform X2 n=1 Tax=Copidosoma floridanum TaxID=29053 RepID=UPI000C6F62E0|nr:protein FAM214A isoform X2 [Copidosoma floridanum]